MMGLAESAGPDDAVLVEGRDFIISPSAPPAGHSAGCACCLPRGPVAEALSRLFLAQIRGEVAYFHRVLAVTETAAGMAAILGAVAEDPVVRARFRLV